MFAKYLKILIIKFKFDKKKSAFYIHFRPIPSDKKYFGGFTPLSCKGEGGRADLSGLTTKKN